MFRSGTTLMSRIIQAHADCCCANDPILPFFKDIRNIAAKEEGISLCSEEEPISDYYYKQESIRLMDSLLNFDLTRPADAIDIVELRAAIAKYTDGFSTLLLPHLGEVNGKTYKDILQSVFEITQKTYGNGNSTVTAMKTPWLDEFTPALLNAFSNIKVIHIIRDVRAVCSSKLSQTGKYSWPFMIRQWRKSGTLIWHHSILNKLENVHIIKYEDLVTSPDKTCQGICDFLGVDYDPEMINPEKFIGHDGSPWMANTSYSHTTAKITTASMNKWKTKLTDTQIRFIEACSADVMQTFDYEKFKPTLEETSDIFSLDMDIPLENIAEWFHPFLDQYGTSPQNIGLEAVRAELFKKQPKLTDEQARAYFLFQEYYEALTQ